MKSRGFSLVRKFSASTKCREIEKFMATTYARPDTVIVKGKGSLLWDSTGKEYVDFSAGIAVTALGHCDEGVSKEISEQVSELMHSSNLFHNTWTPKLSEALVSKTIESGAMNDAAKVFLCNSGTEANEAALKFARKFGIKQSTDKTEILSFRGGFHGRTFGALSATCNPKYQAPFAPMVPGFVYGDINTDSALEMIGDKTCGVIVEPIQGEGGINTCDPSWLKRLREKCDEHNVVLIYDEIQCGLGRTGALWAHSIADGAHPDIITMAKALGNGFPIGATMISEKINNALNVGDHGTTYGGNPLACRVGLHVLNRVSDPKLLGRVTELSAAINTRFQTWISKYPELLTEVRGRGLILGLQVTKDPAPIIQAARDNGLLVITAGNNTIRIIPALTISDSEVVKGLDILEKSLEAAL